MMMTLDEEIKRCEEVAIEQDKLCKRYDDASGYSRRHNEAIRTTDAKRCEKCAEEHRQLAEWLKDYKRLLEQEPCEDSVSRKKVIDTIYRECSGENLDIDFAKVLLLQRKIKALQPVQPKAKVGHCKDCKYFEYDSVAKVDGVPLIVAHEICSKWGDGCKTSEDGYCFLFESQEREET